MRMIWSTKFACFHSSTTAQLMSGKQVRMDELRFEDEVLTLDPATGLTAFSKIYSFENRVPELHRQLCSREAC